MLSLYQKILKKLLEKSYKNRDEFELRKKQICGEFKVRPITNTPLIFTYQELLKNKKIKRNKNFEEMTITRKTRTISGVTPITVLTKPYACPGKCIYCPHEDKMPTSYLSNEPAAQRAKGLKFDPYNQVQYRIKALETNGHCVDKIELLVLGGSWNAYTKKYQNWFVSRCFQGANDYPKNNSNKKYKLEKMLKKNESAKYRIIGETLETRPDLINETELKTMRHLGCTRIQFGVQHTDDEILKKVKRGHNQKDVIRATKLCKEVGLKVDYHLMPDLPFSSPKKDFKMFQTIFDNPNYRPDQIKIYPCIVTREAKILYKMFKNRDYVPYTKKELLNLLINVKTKTIPYYVRINRLIRDIPKESIVGGNDITNLRQSIEREMKLDNLKCKCIRCREVKDKEIKLKDAKLFIEKYNASSGTEFFISYENYERTKLYAFLRLRFNHDKSKNVFSELKNCSIVREIHVYGKLVAHNEKASKTSSQHTGFGKRLMQEAENISHDNNYKKIAVISGIGVREYYKKLGYKLDGEYMVKKLK
ncbi:MAG: tRNA uridine(34) 5-carboxymethylaminomethyl modification radical SAM/GNAT enzyme Elp3 [Patescibacteria group bacterium]|nr:tRNA uridine(34) 5-carboxymethylaminomethyl modification radical SAM/GNAT enzyme Elp3 [Patescibacteria group bacterium]MDD4304765.1 tRNA uridine(34) 5-carboxymethylaminomethyl modification radical SAM/GNAT enzyme Elp3 [Patescibacteria group bacterium]MDD4695496.1 tRNA uridine(34) 5-carboxymethylaminomethyl modification radical SAM/GNAT enzyme Elp3 [Patescibacteria group bacterium]